MATCRLSDGCKSGSSLYAKANITGSVGHDELIFEHMCAKIDIARVDVDVY